MKCPKCGYKWKNKKMVEGGKKSRRTLTKEQAQEMVRKREEKKRENIFIEKN